MPARQKGNIPAPPVWQAPASGTKFELKIKVVTPMFGGGYEAGVVDSACPIRAATIRGQLRFWWRATAGAQYTSGEDLHAAEAALWGESAHEEPNGGGKLVGEGKAKLAVQLTNAGSDVNLDSIRPQSTPQGGPLNGVFLFPFEEQKGQNRRPAQKGRKDVTFTVSIIGDLSDAQTSQVQLALAAWVLFGGVGARTRRGCGALQLTQKVDFIPSDVDSLKVWLSKLPNCTHKLWPTLGGGFLVVGKGSKDAGEGWRSLGRFWCAFRKGHIGAMDYSPMSGGKWRDHATLKALRAGASGIKLAKPFLGLPIIYQEFRNDPRRPFAGTLEPVDSGRMASPLILKTLVFQGGGVRPIVLCLSAGSPKRIRVSDEFQSLELSLPDDEPLLRNYNNPLSVAWSEAKTMLNGELIKIGAST